MDKLFQLWDTHGTRILGIVGFIQGLIAVIIAIPELIPPESFKYWAAANAVGYYLVYRRGQTNAQRQEPPQP